MRQELVFKWNDNFGKLARETLLAEKFGKGGKYRATAEPRPNQDYFDYEIDGDGGRIICVTISPIGEIAKIISIELVALSEFGRMYHKSFWVREIDINNL